MLWYLNCCQAQEIQGFPTHILPLTSLKHAVLCVGKQPAKHLLVQQKFITGKS